jgi:hypothetical protein
MMCSKNDAESGAPFQKPGQKHNGSKRGKTFYDMLINYFLSRFLEKAHKILIQGGLHSSDQ